MEHPVGTDLHDAQFLLKADVAAFAVLLGAVLELADLAHAATRVVDFLKSHHRAVVAALVAERAVLVAERLVLAVGVPIVMRLVQTMVLVHGVVEIAVQPGSAWRDAEVKRLGTGLFGTVVVVVVKRVELLVKGVVDDPIGEVEMGLLPVVFRTVVGPRSHLYF